MSAGAILTINAGSSSIKFSVYATGDEPRLDAVGQIENVGSAAATLTLKRGDEKCDRAIGAVDHAGGLQAILEEIRPVLGARDVVGVGHRIAHGGTDFADPRPLDDDAVARLRRLEPFAPLHQPHNLAAVAAARSAFPGAAQIGCFDTAFHRGHPWVNDTFALPRRFYDEGVRRYGFHGLSYQYVTGELARRAPDLARGRVIVAHLGNGASMCAVKNGRSVASTMGFSALDGLPMGTRCGQLDPGVLLYLMAQKGMSAAEIERLLYRDSGLKGLSGLSNDMRALEASPTPEAAQAIDYFVFRIRREIGAMAAVLGGVDALVFCGGIGENARSVRARVCEGMDWLGLSLDPQRNADNAEDVAKVTSRVRIKVIPTDEERIIARAVNRALTAG